MAGRLILSLWHYYMCPAPDVKSSLFHLRSGQDGYHSEVATEYVFRNCDNRANVLGSTHWKSYFWEPVVNKLPQHVLFSRVG